MNSGRGEELKPVIQSFTDVFCLSAKGKVPYEHEACLGLYWLLISWYNLGTLCTDLVS